MPITVFRKHIGRYIQCMYVYYVLSGVVGYSPILTEIFPEKKICSLIFITLTAAD